MKTKGRPKKTSQDSVTASQKKAILARTRAKGIFEVALLGEKFGKHPGQVDLVISLSVYNAVTQAREDLPGKKIELLVSNIEEVDDIITLTRQVLTDWIAGLVVPNNQGE